MREAEEKAERKKAEDALRRSEESARRSESELRLLIENIPAMVFIALPGGSSAFASRRWREYTGISDEDTAGFGWKSGVHPEDLERHLRKWQLCSETAEPFEDEARFRRAADGTYRWFLVRAVPLPDETGSVLKWYGVVTDIEDRKRAEEALRRSERYLAEAQRLSHTGSWAIDVASRRGIHSSEEHHRLFGFEPGADMPPWEDWVQRIHPEDRERIVATMEQGIRERTDFEMDYRTVHPDGTIRYVQCRRPSCFEPVRRPHRIRGHRRRRHRAQASGGGIAEGACRARARQSRYDHGPAHGLDRP